MSSSHKNHDQGHGKKRRHRDVDSDLEDHGHSSRRREKKSNPRRDALTDFRARIIDEGVGYPRSDVGVDSAHAPYMRHRGHRSTQDSRKREIDDGYHSHRSREHITETRRCSNGYSSRKSHHRRDESDKRHSRRHSCLDENKDEDKYYSKAKAREIDETSEDRSSYHTYRLNESRGRSLSKSGSTHSRNFSNRSLSSRSSSRDSYYRHRTSKRRRSRSKSHSVDGRKERKSRKHRSSSSQKKGRDRDKARDDSKRSVLTGKKIKLKVKKDQGDDERDAKREELLKFLNSAYE